ncbi:MAG: ribonuclease R [Terrimicrobiaceae bacterium]
MPDPCRVPNSERPSAGKPDPRQRIVALLSQQPLDKQGLSKALGWSTGDRRELKALLRELELDGVIVRVRKDRYVLPRDADLVVGLIQFHRNGSAHLVPLTTGERELAIRGENTGTAMHGDRVVARRENPPGGLPSGRQQEGRVIRILKRASDTVVGTLQKTESFFYVVADDPRFPHNLYVPQPTMPARIGDKVVARLTDWPTRHVNPEGEVVEVIGPAGAPGVDLLSLIRKHNLPGDFPEEVLAEARDAAARADDHAPSRRDHRKKFIFTIDPDDARDFDDAIEIEKSGDGWQLGVHIADVSHYVRPRSALDKEARTRGNSVYLPERVIPMLPEALSNGICSLRPHEDRMVFSVHAKISKDGRVLSRVFSRGIIRSAARLTYRQALAMLQAPPADETSQRVHMAWSLASVLRRNRFRDGSLDLDFPEIKVRLDAEGRPERLEKVENDISHQLIEELMLLANELVAHELKSKRQPAVYRVHESPEPERLEEFRQAALAQGLRCGDLTRRAELQSLIERIKGKPYESTLKIALLKSLKRARYSPEPLGHYGLHKSDYAHFTSPIRRYADLVVHRALERQLGLSRSGPDARTLTILADHISATERSAAEAERESVRVKQLEFFKMQLDRRTGATFRARVLEVRNYGLFVELPDCMMSGLIHISAIDGDFFAAEPFRGRLIGRRTRRIISVGDEMNVIVARVDLFKQQVDFAPAEKQAEATKRPDNHRPTKKQNFRKEADRKAKTAASDSQPASNRKGSRRRSRSR